MKSAELKGRKRDVAYLILKGYTGPEIARLLGIAVSTVHTLRYRIFEMFGVHSDLQLFALAVKESPDQALELAEQVLP